MGGPQRREQYVTPPPGAPSDADELAAIYQALGGVTSDLASRPTLAAVQALLAGKASTASVDALTALLSGKAAQTTVDTLTTALSGKATGADLTAAIARVTALEGGRALAADLAAAVARIAVVEGSLPTKATLQALTDATARIGVLEAGMAAVPQFVAAGSMVVEDLLSIYPANASRRGKYARVTNYGGAIDRVLRCDYDQNLNYYFWTPTRGEYGRTLPLTSDMTLKRLLSPSSVVLSGTVSLGVTRNITIDTANATPGEIIEIKAPGAGIAGSLNILGTGLGSAISLLAGSYQKYMIDGSSGTLQVVRLV